ncbi:9506_t:CDS:2 [Ambispora leptoticha]|uniref:9506_t:CDS:1 n=1 Tax=Ambispora leptoticha TaxID=144679 RepID=A0A9N8Z4L0_9GLOM|nr:9506_t:CDS:2 [Ambispora leptoticha]
MSSSTIINRQLLDFVRNLLNPVPQYVLGSLPAIATIGAAPMEDFFQKIMWVFRCLGCPFIGLFYTCNIPSDETAIFWLPKRCFRGVEIDRHDNSTIIKEIPYKPVGHHAMLLIMPEFNQRFVRELEANARVLQGLDECVANASVLERFSSLVAAYYISVGIIAAIARVFGPVVCEDWPYIPLLLAWTLPAIYRRIIHGRLLVRDPNKRLGDNIIYVREFDHIQDKESIHIRVVITAIASITVPWTTIILAYSTPPTGFFCRSKYISVICALWSFNSFLGYIHHLVGEKNKVVDYILGVWYSLCGLFVGFLLFLLTLLSKKPELWYPNNLKQLL